MTLFNAKAVGDPDKAAAKQLAASDPQNMPAKAKKPSRKAPEAFVAMTEKLARVVPELDAANTKLRAIGSKLTEAGFDSVDDLIEDWEDADQFREKVKDGYKDPKDFQRAAKDWKAQRGSPDDKLAALLDVTQLGTSTRPCICGTKRARTHLCSQHGADTYDDEASNDD